jgi:hypothetical protein
MSFVAFLGVPCFQVSFLPSFLQLLDDFQGLPGRWWPLFVNLLGRFGWLWELLCGRSRPSHGGVTWGGGGGGGGGVVQVDVDEGQVTGGTPLLRTILQLLLILPTGRCRSFTMAA